MSNDEMFDILDENGEKTGVRASKSEVHQRGLWHTGVHLCVTDGKGHIFQQQRGVAPAVRILPGVWDLFIAAGHVSAGEDPLDALARETFEEIGRKISRDLLAQCKVGITRSDYWVDDPTFENGGYHHRVYDHTYVMCIPDLDLHTLVLEPGKVTGVRAYPIEQLALDIKQPECSRNYSQHAHRPVDDARLYQMVIDRARTLRA